MMKNIKIFTLIFLFVFSISSNISSDESLNNKIYKNLRCIVCQGQSIADSNSDFAQTIKSVVNDKIKEGMDEKQIYIFLSEKYGDWILFDPPLKRKSFLLWSLPYLFFIIGAFVLLFALKKTLKQRKF